MILVTGATGVNGRELIIRLAASGQRTRALVKNLDKAAYLKSPYVELIKGDFSDAATLDAALKGVEKAFVLVPVDARALEWFGAFFKAAQKAPVSHIVKFSGMGAGALTSEILRQHGEADALLQKSGLAYTLLRPNSFYQNMLWSAASIKEQGAFYLPLGDARQSLVDVRDIASVAFTVLTQKGHEGKIYEITGPQALTYTELADSISKAVGKPVKYVAVTPQAAEESMLKAGMSAWNARALVDIYGYFASGAAAKVTDTVAQITGRPPIPFDQFVRDHAEAFK